MDAPENRSNQPKEPLRSTWDGVRTLHEFMFSLNVASAFGYALLVYVSMNQASTTPANDSTYYFLRGAFRINDLLHLPSTNSVSTRAVAREFASRWSQVGDELLILLSTFCIATLVLLLLRLIAGTSAYRAILAHVAGLTALFAAPAFYLY